MKNRIFNISITLLLSIFVLVSCSEDSEEISSNHSSYETQSSVSIGKTQDNNAVGSSQPNLTSADIGKYHNEAINLYYRNGGGSGATIQEIQDEIIVVMQQAYPTLMKDFKISTDYNFISAYYGEKSINPTQKKDLVNAGLNKMVSEKTITSNFADGIKNVTLVKDTYTNKMKMLNSIKVTNNEESYLLDTYKEVLTNSNNLWNDGGTQSARLKCSSGVIAADAVGAAVGLFGGPLWSIIQGAVVSIAVNEDC